MPIAADAALVQPPHAVVAAAASTWQTVTVRPGDTIWELALTHHTTVQALVDKNRLPRGGDLIQVGQKLLVPGSGAAGTSAPAKSTAAKSPTKPKPRPAASYTVRPGDTLSVIAERHGVSLRALVAANRIANPGLIHPGQRIAIPAGGPASSPAPASPAKPTTTPATKPAPAPKPSASPAPAPTAPQTAASAYTVQPGDTLSGIAVAHKVSLASLLTVNDIEDAGLIYPGQRLALPAGAAAPTPSPTTSKPTPTSENTFAGYTYSDTIVGAAKANRDALAARNLPSRTETADLIRTIATRYGVDPRLALAIAWQESGWNQRVVSVANAVGTMQVIPSSGEWASELAGRKLDLLDTEDNVTAGVVIIKALLRAADSREQAIAGYYQGLYSVQTKGLYQDTKGYVAAVMAHYARM